MKNHGFHIIRSVCSLFHTLIILLWTAGVVFSQEKTLGLEEACRLAVQNHAMHKNFEVLDQRLNLATKAIRSAYLPQLGLNAQVSWQSEVTRVDIPVPGIVVPAMEKDQYKAGLEATQVVYDGGAARHLLDAEKAAHTVRQLETEAELFRLTQRVDALFFSVILLRQQARILEVQIETFNSRIKQCESAYRHGLATQSQCDVLEAGKMSVLLALKETAYGIRAGLDALEIYCGTELDDTTELQLPALNIPEGSVQIERPDLYLFDATTRQLEFQNNLLKAKALPRISGFAQAGYGRPGLNMLDPDFKGYFLAGLRLNMPLWTWHKTRNESAVTEQASLSLMLQGQAFRQGITVRLNNLLQEANKYKSLEAHDMEIVRLRSRIARQAGIQYDEGILAANDLVQYLNEETQARLALEQHKLQAAYAAIQWARESGQIR